MQCTIRDCPKPLLCKGLCAMHYTRQRKHGDVNKVQLPMERHGYAKTPTHNVWCSIKARCGNVRSDDYPRYGGRGIKICERWRNSFSAFLTDMGPKPPGDISID